MGNVCALVRTETPEHCRIMVADRAGVDLHDQPVLAAHAGHLNQHMRGEASGVCCRRLARQAPLENCVGLVGSENLGKRRFRPMIGGGRAHLSEEIAAGLQRRNIGAVIANVDAGDGAQQVDLLRPGRLIDPVNDLVRTKSRVYAPVPVRFLDRLVVFESIGGCVGSSQRLHPKLFVQLAGRKFRGGQPFGYLVVDSLGVRRSQLFGNAKEIVKLIPQPQSGGRTLKQVIVFGKGLPDFTVIRFDGAGILPFIHRHALGFKGNSLRVEHPKDIVIRDQEQLCRGFEMVRSISEKQRVHMAVRADQRQVGYAVEQGARHSPLFPAAAEISIGSLRHILA